MLTTPFVISTLIFFQNPAQYEIFKNTVLFGVQCKIFMLCLYNVHINIAMPVHF
jgi:hypothetical protein